MLSFCEKMYIDRKLASAEKAVKSLSSGEVANELLRGFGGAAKYLKLWAKAMNFVAVMYTAFSKSEELRRCLVTVIDRSKYILADVLRQIREDEVLLDAARDLSHELGKFDKDLEGSCRTWIKELDLI